MSSHTSYEHMTLRELKALPEVRLLPGWHEMPKAEIIRRLAENARNASKKGKKARAKEAPSAKEPAAAKPPRGQKSQAAPASEAKTGKSAAKESKNTVKSAGKSAGKQTPEAKPPKKAAGKKAAEDAVIEAAAKKKQTGSRQSKKVTPEMPAALVSKGNKAGKSLDEEKNAPKTAKGRARKQPEVKPEVPAEEEVKRSAKQEEAKAEAAKPARKRAELPPKEEPEEIESIQVRSDQERLRRLQEAKQLRSTLATPQIEGQEPEDRLVLTALGPYWLHVWWEISPKMVQKARSVLARDWFAAEPVLRLMRGIPNSIGNLRWEIFSEQKIVGGVFNWYLKVDDPPQMYQVEIGYRYKNGFYSLLTSGTVETPENYEQEGMSPQTGWRPRYDTGRYPRGRGFGGGSIVLDEEDIAGLYDAPFNLTVDAEVIIKGTTSPNARLTIRDKPVKVESDGTFWVPYRLPERRHIFQVVASAIDGTQTRTIVMAIDRNTKELETVHDYPEE